MFERINKNIIVQRKMQKENIWPSIDSENGVVVSTLLLENRLSPARTRLDRLHAKVCDAHASALACRGHNR